MNKLRWSLILAVLASGCDEEATSPDAEFVSVSEFGTLMSDFAVPVEARRVDEVQAREIITQAVGESSFSIPESGDSASSGATPVEGVFETSDNVHLFDSCGDPNGTMLEAVHTVGDLSANGYSISLGGPGEEPLFTHECAYAGQVGTCSHEQVIDFSMLAGVDAVLRIEETNLHIWGVSGNLSTWARTDISCEGEECGHPIPSGVFDADLPCVRVSRNDLVRVADLPDPTLP